MNSVTYNNRRIYPSKVVCVGRNYIAHIEELNNELPEQAVIFIKPNSSISNTLQINSSDPISYESEISFLILDGQISGVAFGLDLTKRETQTKLKTKGLPWERAKAFDGAAVFSEFVSSPRSVESLRIELEINDRLLQQGMLSQMINTPDSLIDEITSFMSFADGDVLMTGTPSGVGLVEKGDVFVGRIFDDSALLLEKKWRVS